MGKLHHDNKEKSMWFIKGNVICIYDKGYLLQLNDKVYYIDEHLGTKELLFKLKRSSKKGIVSKLGRLGSRFTRSDVKAGAIFEDTLFFSDFGTCFAYNFNCRKLIPQHQHRTTMRSPLNYCVIEGIQSIEGFDDQVCYGEYFDNSKRDSVSIWSRCKGAVKWQIAFTFDAGTIRHIHGIFVDKWRKCVYILTGDKDDESAIWIAKNNFKNVYRLISGNQQARACQMMVNKHGFLYCTDSEYEENILYDVVIKDPGITNYQRSLIKTFDSSIIYGCSTDNEFFFATTVEPNKGGIKSKYVHVYHVSGDRKVRKIITVKKDVLPMKLFQYGYARIVVRQDTVALSFCGVKKYDGKTIIIDRMKHG